MKNRVLSLPRSQQKENEQLELKLQNQKLHNEQTILRLMLLFHVLHCTDKE